MKYTIFTILLCLSTFSMAKNKTQYIPSTVLPPNVSAEQYQLLLDEYKKTPKAKAAADAKAKAKADAEKTEAKHIAYSTKKEFENKIYNAWEKPKNSTGQTATIYITLNHIGNIVTLLINTSDPDMKASIEAAIRSATPFEMPSNTYVIHEVRYLKYIFTSE